MDSFKTVILLVFTAVAEMVGCYLPYLWLRESKPIWLLIPAMASLTLFAWLLTLHPSAAGRGLRGLRRRLHRRRHDLAHGCSEGTANRD